MSGLRQHKSVKYSKELTSLQIWRVLNELIYEAAAPFCVYADMSIETALSCLAISTNNRRKLTAEKANLLREALFVELAQQIDPTPDSKLDLLNFLLQRGIERNVFIDHIAYALQTAKLPPQIDRQKLAKHVGIQFEGYETFKRDVVFRYYHFIETFASRNYHAKFNRGLKSTKDDMFHVYIISAMRALDKFVPFEGTLTKYIQNWFQNAEGSSDFITYDNEAFSLNRAVRKSVQEGEKNLNNKAIPIHDREATLSAPDEQDESSDFAEYSRHLAKLPNAVVVFLAQSIPYVLSHEQKQMIEQHNREQA